jgi:hypothetical protein
MPRRSEDERSREDYAGDQPQGPGPDDEDRVRPGERPGHGRPRRAGRAYFRPYFRFVLESAAARPRLM